MPIYEYQCKICKKIGEAFIFADNEPSPKCHKLPMSRIISVPSMFILKGEGFYKPTHIKDPETKDFEKC